MNIDKKRFIVIELIFIVIVCVAAFFVLEKIEKTARIEQGRWLKSMLNVTNNALNLWIDNRERNILTITNNEKLIALTKNLLKVPRNKESLIESPIQSQIRKFVKDDLLRFNDLGIFIISPDYISISSMRDENIGDVNLIWEQRPNVLTQVFQGEVKLVPPLYSDVELNKNGISPDRTPTMFIVAPIYDSNKIIAVFAYRIDEKEEFSKLVEIGRTGNTGETYAFDNNAVLISQSRYDDQLKKMGRIKDDELSMLNIIISEYDNVLINENYKHNKLETSDSIDSQYNYLPSNLTVMAESAIKGNSEVNIKGYRDYRGEQVLGAWLWNDKLGIGLTTEIDESEALNSFHQIQFTIKLFIIVILIICILTIFYFLQYKQKVSQNDELIKINALKDRFFTIISHDIKSPVGSINMLLELLQTKLAKYDDDEIDKMMSILQDTTSRTVTLVEDLLVWSRVHGGTIDFKPKSIDFNDIVEQNMMLFSTLSTSKEIQLINKSKTSCPIFADSEMISMILRNIVSNAIKFTDEKGIIMISYTIKEGEFIALVEDTGVGIKPEELEKLLKGNKVISRKGTSGEKGTGLGLTLCKEFVEIHKGKIWVESEVDKGSKFSFSIPSIVEK